MSTRTRLGGGVAERQALTPARARTAQAPHQRIDMAPLRVPADAELRLALGVDARGADHPSPARIGIGARAPSGRSLALIARTLRPDESAWGEVRVPLDDARQRLGADFRLVFKA